MSHTTNGSWFVVHVWMATELGLSGMALLVYSLVFGFTVCAPGRCYHGSLATMALYTGGTKQTVHNVLKRLVSAELLRKTVSGKGQTRRVTYTALRGPGGQFIDTSQKIGPHINILGPNSGPNSDMSSGPDAGRDDGGGTAGARPAVARVMESGEVEHVV